MSEYLHRAKVSIVVVNCNGLRFLKNCLTSIRAQSFSDFELWLVDNGSTDGSVELVRNRFQWVRIIDLGRNAGFSVANNIAIRHSTGEFVVLLNNDTSAEPNWLEELISGMSADERVGICASRVLYMTRPELLYAAGDIYSRGGVAFRRGDGLLAQGNFEIRDEVFSACACAAMYRRSMLDQVGLLDEDFFSNYEDVDLAFRARLAGYTCMYVPSARVYHYGSGTAGVANPAVEFLTSRNLEYVFFKNAPFTLLLRSLPRHILHMAWLLIKKWRAGLARPYLKGKLAFVLQVPSVMRKRAEVQRVRSVHCAELRAAMKILETKEAGAYLKQSEAISPSPSRLREFMRRTAALLMHPLLLVLDTHLPLPERVYRILYARYVETLRTRAVEGRKPEPGLG